MSVAIIDYGSGNLHSAAKAFERAARETGDRIVVTSDADAVAKAERIVLPGVGAFADCRRGLDAVPGMVAALNEAVIERGTPFLGICVGCQLMAERGLEKETSEGLGWIAGDVVEIEPARSQAQDPAHGLEHARRRAATHPILAGIPTGRERARRLFRALLPRRAARGERSRRVGRLRREPVTAIVGRDNYVGTQFHPEKSQALGLALIANFLKWKP